MVALMMVAKSIQLQLQSSDQQEIILLSCKQLADHYKTLKSILEKGMSNNVTTSNMQQQ